MTALERILALVDENSFKEIDSEVSKSAITGFATISKRDVCIVAQDKSVKGGSLGKNQAKRIKNIFRIAIKLKIPILTLNDSGGARIQEGVEALSGYGEIFKLNVEAKGKIPQIAVILGPCAGGAAYSPALMDFVFAVRNLSKMFINGPKVIFSNTGEEVSAENLGGADVLSEISGNAHFVADNEEVCFKQIRKLFEFIPQNSECRTIKAEIIEPAENFLSEINLNKDYNVLKIIKSVADGSDFVEVKSGFAKNCVVGFAKIKGKNYGIVANQRIFDSGLIDINAADKISEFIEFCDNFNIPILTFQDISGFMCSKQQEHNGLIRHGSKIISAYCKSKVEKTTIILNQAIGGGYVAMGSKQVGAQRVIAVKNTLFAVMKPDSAVEILYHKELEKIENKAEFIAEKIAEYSKNSSAEKAKECGFVDEIIELAQIREIL